jgi:acyl carrier protein
MRELEGAVLDCLDRSLGGNSGVTPESELGQLVGFDSVTLAGFLAELEDRFAIVLRTKDMNAVRWVDDVVPLVAAELARQGGTHIEEQGRIATGLSSFNQELLRGLRYERELTVVMIRRSESSANASEEAQAWARLDAFGRRIQRTLRSADRMTSLGADCLVVVLPETEVEHGGQVIERWLELAGAERTAHAFRVLPVLSKAPAQTSVPVQWVRSAPKVGTPVPPASLAGHLELSEAGTTVGRLHAVALLNDGLTALCEAPLGRSSVVVSAPEAQPLPGWPVLLEVRSESEVQGRRQVAGALRPVKGKDPRIVHRALAAAFERAVMDELRAARRMST